MENFDIFLETYKALISPLTEEMPTNVVADTDTTPTKKKKKTDIIKPKSLEDV